MDRKVLHSTQRANTMADTNFVGETTGNRFRFISQQGNGRIMIEPVPDMSIAEAESYLRNHPKRQDFDDTKDNFYPIWFFGPGQTNEPSWAVTRTSEGVGTFYYSEEVTDILFIRALRVYWGV
jgi:hypothetical protein